MLKNQVFANLVFSRAFIIFGTFWEAFWLSFGVLLEPPASLWRAGALLLGASGSPEPSVGSLCFFLSCLFARLGCFGDLFAHFGSSLAFLLGFGSIFELFRDDFRCRFGLIFCYIRCYFRVFVLSVSVLCERSFGDFCCYEERREETRRGETRREGKGRN